MDSLQGAIPSVILFPAAWNATLLENKNNPLRNAFRQIIGSLSVTSTVTMVGYYITFFFKNLNTYTVTVPFHYTSCIIIVQYSAYTDNNFILSQAATCFGLFTENSPFIETGALPEDFWPMILAAMSIQYAGVMVESIVAKLKGLPHHSMHIQ